MTLETVIVETPAAAATSCIVAFLPRARGCVLTISRRPQPNERLVSRSYAST
jgi:hypothetical protein